MGEKDDLIKSSAGHCVWTKVLERYCRVDETEQAEVESYFDCYQGIQEKAKTNWICFTYQIVRTLMHEIFHHLVRGQQHLRRPRLEIEETRAKEWADRMVG